MCSALLLEISEIEKQIAFYQSVLSLCAPQVLAKSELERDLVYLLQLQLNTEKE